MIVNVEKRIKRCAWCGSDFEEKRRSHKYCTKTCKAMAYFDRPAGKEVKKKANLKYKDKKRHDGKRKELIGENGYVCNSCGKRGTSFEIVAHHSTFNADDHDSQELLCRSCHARTHHSGESSPSYKHVHKEDIEYALDEFDTLDEMCEYLKITRSTLYKKRKEYGLPSRTNKRGFNNRRYK